MRLAGFSSAPRPKGIAVWAIVLVVIFGFAMFVLFVVFAGYLHIQNCEMAAAVCSSRQSSFCMEWWRADHTFGSGKPNWEKVDDCQDGTVGELNCPEPTQTTCGDLINQ